MERKKIYYERYQNRFYNLLISLSLTTQKEKPPLALKILFLATKSGYNVIQDEINIRKNVLENRSKPVTCVWTPILHPDAYKPSPIPGVIAWACVFQELGFSSVWTLVLFLLCPFSAFQGFGSFRRDYEDSRHHPGLRASSMSLSPPTSIQFLFLLRKCKQHSPFPWISRFFLHLFFFLVIHVCVRCVVVIVVEVMHFVLLINGFCMR